MTFKLKNLDISVQNLEVNSRRTKKL